MSDISITGNSPAGDLYITIMETPADRDSGLLEAPLSLSESALFADRAVFTDALDVSPFSAKAAELSHAAETAPSKLLDRENELQTLSDYCKNDSGYFTLQAPAWHGKSALLSWFFLHPPQDTEVVGFFVTMREARWSDGDAFENSIKAQLRNILKRYEKWSDSFVSSTLLSLMEYAAKVIGELGRRLVLIVDALDEDRSGERELSYILRRLPKNNIANLVIILSSRPNPNMQDVANLDNNHPARNCTIHLLTQSPHAKVQQELADKALEEIHDSRMFFAGNGRTRESEAAILRRRHGLDDRLGYG